MNADMNGGAVSLFACDLVNVNDELFAVDAHNAARVALVVAARDSHLVLNAENKPTPMTRDKQDGN